MKITIAYLLILCSGLSMSAQKHLDSILNSLNNKNLEISIVSPPAPVLFKGVKPVPLSERPIDYDLIASLDIRALAEQYDRKVLVKKLVPLLMDSIRDVYANAILYVLHGRSVPYKSTRENWFRTSRSKDQIHWNLMVNQMN